MKHLSKAVLVGSMALAFNANSANLDGQPNSGVNTLNLITISPEPTVLEEQAARIAADNAIAQRFVGTNRLIRQQAINLEGNSASKANAAEERAVARAIAADAANSQAIQNETNRAIGAEALLRQETRQVGALSMAAAAAAGAGGSMVTEAKPTSISMAMGTYSGYGALALGVTHRIREDVRIYGTVSGGNSGRTGAGVGAAFSF